MNYKHTPGPWDKYGDNEIRTRERESRAIAEVWLFDVTDAEQKANMALICAAPDLLVAAVAVVERWDTPAWKDAAPTADVIAQLRAAIAKATA